MNVLRPVLKRERAAVFLCIDQDPWYRITIKAERWRSAPDPLYGLM
jgi:hypothetical protein